MNNRSLFFLTCLAIGSSLSCMENKKEYLPELIEKKIIKMVLFRQPPEWVAWLIERNAAKSWQQTYLNCSSCGLTRNCREFLIRSYHNTYKPLFDDIIEFQALQETSIDCSRSFIHFKLTHPHTLAKKDPDGLIVIRDKGPAINCIPILETQLEDIIDSAESKDGKIFVAATQKSVTIGEIPSGKLMYKIFFNNDPLLEIVSIDPATSSLVMQNKFNQIFVYNWQDNTQHLLFNGSNYDNVHCIAFDKSYRIICEKNRGTIKTIRDLIMTDIGRHLRNLQLDQIRLLNLIHLAYTKYKQKKALHELNKNDLKKRYKVNLTKTSDGIVHAREAFLAMPAEIQYLVKDFVELPSWWGTATNKLSSFFVRK